MEKFSNVVRVLFLPIFISCVAFLLPQLSQAQVDNQLKEYLEKHDRPYMTDLIEKDSILLIAFRSQDLEAKATVDSIVAHFESGKHSNPMKAELAKLLLQDNTYCLDAFFHILPNFHNHSNSLRPYEMMNYPVACTLYEEGSKLSFVKSFVQQKSFWDQCDRLDHYDDLPKIFLYGFFENYIPDYELTSDKLCAKLQYETIFKY